MPELPDRIDGEIIEASHMNEATIRSVQRYANVSERDSLNPAPETGQPAWIIDDQELHIWNGSAWIVAGAGVFLPLSGGTMAGDINLAGFALRQIADMVAMYGLALRIVDGSGKVRLYTKEGSDTTLYDHNGVAIASITPTGINLRNFNLNNVATLTARTTSDFLFYDYNGTIRIVVRGPGANEGNMDFRSGTGAQTLEWSESAGQWKFFNTPDIPGYLQLSGGTISGTLNMAGVLNMQDNQLINVADPTGDRHAVPRAYVDAGAPYQRVVVKDGSGLKQYLDISGRVVTYSLWRDGDEEQLYTDIPAAYRPVVSGLGVMATGIIMNSAGSYAGIRHFRIRQDTGATLEIGGDTPQPSDTVYLTATWVTA